ncbi:MAG TPA: hypothetical protein VNO22_17245 [Planctomycetota bacterium]|jgi:hypothetical protein|nr:hypothetical protein [Planctomycetota bacterium]
MKRAAMAILGAALAAGVAGARDEEGASCGRCGGRTYGTAVVWEDSPSEAARKAKAEGKLVFLLHVSGNFEDPRFT